MKVEKSEKMSHLSVLQFAGWLAALGVSQHLCFFKDFAFQHLFTEEQHVKIAMLKCVQIHLFVQTVKRDRLKIGALW